MMAVGLLLNSVSSGAHHLGFLSQFMKKHEDVFFRLLFISALSLVLIVIGASTKAFSLFLSRFIAWGEKNEEAPTPVSAPADESKPEDTRSTGSESTSPQPDPQEYKQPVYKSANRTPTVKTYDVSRSFVKTSDKMAGSVVTLEDIKNIGAEAVRRVKILNEQRRRKKYLEIKDKLNLLNEETRDLLNHA
jgi:hypothetical protein